MTPGTEDLLASLLCELVRLFREYVIDFPIRFVAAFIHIQISGRFRGTEGANGLSIRHSL
jgi:hypothetical protein